MSSESSVFILFQSGFTIQGSTSVIRHSLRSLSPPIHTSPLISPLKFKSTVGYHFTFSLISYQPPHLSSPPSQQQLKYGEASHYACNLRELSRGTALTNRGFFTALNEVSNWSRAEISHTSKRFSPSVSAKKGDARTPVAHQEARQRENPCRLPKPFAANPNA